MAKIESANIPSISLQDRGTDADTPSSGFVSFYIKNGEAYVRLDNGTVINIADSGSITLDGLSNVSITSAQDGDILRYNFGFDVWENTTFPTVPSNLDDLSDVNLPSVNTGALLQYTGTEWTHGANSGSIADRDVLMWDNLSSVWSNNLLALDDLSDVDTTGVAKGTLMVYDGSQWIMVNVGTDGQVLTADSLETSGVKWA
jgi:hypothetical protein